MSCNNTKANNKRAALKLNIQLGLTTVFFLVELVIGYLINSIALMADALHMLNDVFSLAIALYCNRLKQNSKQTLTLTYGFQRAEVLGALINSVLLVGLCITILLEAVPRFFNPVQIKNPILLLVVGVIGLLFNVFGMFLFGHNHSHGHGDHHSHNHEGGDAVGADVQHSDNDYITDDDPEFSTAHFQQRIIDEGRNLSRGANANNGEEEGLLSNSSHEHKHENINMRGIYLHVLGDALANVAVIITSVIIMLVQSNTKYIVDPIISVVITLLIMKLTIPLIKSASLILLQVVPTNISLENIRSNILNINGVYGVHELHVWHLADNKIVASCHVTTDKGSDYMKQAAEIKKMFHTFGIHSVTIQPEYVEKNTEGRVVSRSGDLNNEEEISVANKRNTQCILNCNTDCNEAQCCPTPDNHE